VFRVELVVADLKRQVARCGRSNTTPPVTGSATRARS
jgi:hypothetical protein